MERLKAKGYLKNKSSLHFGFPRAGCFYLLITKPVIGITMLHAAEHCGTVGLVQFCAQLKVARKSGLARNAEP